MRNFRAHGGAFLVLSAALLCLCPRFGYADGEPILGSSSESEGVPTEELGTGIFSRFPFRISISARGGYDDNVSTSQTDKQASWFTNAGATLTYDFGSPRTQLSLNTTWGFTYYFDQPTNGQSNNGLEPNLNLSLSVTHKATPRLTLSAKAYATYQTEPDFSLSLGVNRRSGNFFYTQDKLLATYLWTPRFSTATSYTFSTIQYDDSAVGAFEDRVENTIGNEFRFLIWPTTTLVGEYRFQLVTYDTIARDSMTNFILGGIDHKFNPRLSASFRGGGEFRSYQDAGTNGSPYFESSLTYALGRDTSVSWTNRYGIEESDTLLSPSRKTFRTGLQLNRNFTPRITGSFAAYYQNDDYDGLNTPLAVSAPFTEESFDVAISLRYGVTRYLGIEAGYNHTEVWSDVPLREYSRNRVWGGLSLSF